MHQNRIPPAFQPAGHHAVTPRIIVRGAEALVAFVKEVFAATGEYRSGIPAELYVGDSVLMISEACVREAMPACLYVCVENADTVWSRAVKGGRGPSRLRWIRPTATEVAW